MITWLMTARDLQSLRTWPRYVWGPISL